MKIQVSSGITFIYKYVLFPMWGLSGVGMSVLVYAQTRKLDPSLVILGLMLAMICFAWLMIRKIREVFYDEKFIYLRDINFQRTINLQHVKSINEGSILSFDPWFEIELYPVDGIIEKFNFMPEIHEHIAYSLFGRLSKKLIGFKRAVYESRISISQGMEGHV
jgi:hypothetical protein